jgi:hypothetical protein
MIQRSESPTQRPTRLSDSVLDLPIEGVRLDARTVRELGADGPVLLVFLRHFG